MLGVDDGFTQGMADFKVKVGSPGAAGVAAVANDLALTNRDFTGFEGQIQFKLKVLIVPRLDPFSQRAGVALQVGINRGVAVGVIQIHGKAITRRRGFDTAHMTIGGGQDRDTGIPPGPVIQS